MSPSPDDGVLTAGKLEALFQSIRDYRSPCADGHTLLDIGPTLDLCQCAGCRAFFPRPGGPRKPGARQWADRRDPRS